MRVTTETARTNIVLDTHLVDLGLELSGLTTRRELVDAALRDFVRRKQQQQLLELKGKVDWEGDLDEMRTTDHLDADQH